MLKIVMCSAAMVPKLKCMKAKRNGGVRKKHKFSWMNELSKRQLNVCTITFLPVFLQLHCCCCRCYLMLFALSNTSTTSPILFLTQFTFLSLIFSTYIFLLSLLEHERSMYGAKVVCSKKKEGKHKLKKQ